LHREASICDSPAFGDNIDESARRRAGLARRQAIQRPDNPLALKIEAFTRLSADERAALDRLSSKNQRTVEARRDVVREGDKPRVVNLVLDGWACRYKQLPDGRRQVVSFFIPGDLCDANVFILKEMDHSIGAITRVKIAEIAPDDFQALMNMSPRITQALWWHELANSAVSREWTTNIGQRTAYERIAHLLCEMFIKLRTVGLTRDHECDFPLTQTDIADATGLTAVHVNRTLQELRRDGLIELASRVLHIPDLKRLQDVAMFNPNYLHLDHEGRHLDAND
jgi:CRP-like cAMP-binding protein